MPQGLKARLTVRAMENQREESGSSITCVATWPGLRKVECRFQSGQVPPNCENGKRPEEKRFDKLTCLSIAPLLSQAIKEVFEDGSVTKMFDGQA